jgi:hypothetical protein
MVEIKRLVLSRRTLASLNLIVCRQMARSVRFWVAPFGGIGISVAVWLVAVSIHPIFWQFGASGLVPAIVSGTLGGLTSSVIAPSRKVLISFLVGLLLTAGLLFLLFGHEPGWSRNLWFWWWPIWLLPSYVLGGYLGRRYWQAV